MVNFRNDGLLSSNKQSSCFFCLIKMSRTVGKNVLSKEQGLRDIGTIFLLYIKHDLAACAVAADNIYSGWQLNCCCVAAVDQSSCQVVYIYGQSLRVVQRAALYVYALGH